MYPRRRPLEGDPWEASSGKDLLEQAPEGVAWMGSLRGGLLKVSHGGVPFEGGTWRGSPD